MSKFNKSLYALNKYSENIVYQFGNETKEITLEEYLKENPTHTKEDFFELKKISDEMHHEEDLSNTSYRKKKLSIHTLNNSIPLSEECILEKILKSEDKRKIELAAKNLLDGGNITKIQKKRFIKHFFLNKSLREIAKEENVSHIAIYNSIKYATEKLKKIFDLEG